MSLEQEIYKQFEICRLWLTQSQELDLGQPLGVDKLKAISVYLELLQRWSKKMDLVAPASSEQLIERHLVDCYAAYLLLKSSLGEFKTCLDVGSGAGLPGLVFAILEPAAHFSLCEPREKRQLFLREATSELDNVEILGCRLEDIQEQRKFELITSRALGFEESFDSYAQPLLTPAGKVCQMLGPSWSGEGRAAPTSILNYSLYSKGPERKLVFW